MMNAVFNASAGICDSALPILPGRGSGDYTVLLAHQDRPSRSEHRALTARCWRLLAFLSCLSFSVFAQETATEVTQPKNVAAVPKPAPGKMEKLSIAFRKDVPSSLDDLKAMEKRIKEIAARVSPAVVAVRVDGASGSGVVISEDGLVLTAAHVCDQPNRDDIFTFPDGKTAKGTTLGTNHEMDSGLMKIADEGEWPHVDVGELDRARLGDWVLALGHPGGFDPQRPMVVRLGRIIRLTRDGLQTDCTLISGDSGGPLFDMYGRVIGIHSRISNATSANFHVPIGTFFDTWERLAKGESWGDQRPPLAYIGARGVDDPEGCRLDRVDENSPAAKAGLKVGDIVMKVNDQEIKGYDAFRQNVSKASPGAGLTLQIKRDDKEISLGVTVETRGRRGRRAP